MSILVYHCTANIMHKHTYRCFSERGDIPTKTSALKKVMYHILNGEKMPGILMTIIRFVLPVQDHAIKKLLLIFWEIVPKTQPDGKLLHEMILVCDAYRKVVANTICYIPSLHTTCNCLLCCSYYCSYFYSHTIYPHISLPHKYPFNRTTKGEPKYTARYG